MDRASVFGTECREFESLRVRHFFKACFKNGDFDFRKSTLLKQAFKGTSLVSEALKNSTQEALLKALKHLEYSYQKVLKGELVKKASWTEEELETLESFSSRFARSSDIFLSKYLRILALESDPGFRGTFIDMLNLAEKMNWIYSAKQWARIRELRNVAAHEYAQEELQTLFQEIVRLTPLVLSIHPRI